MANKIKTRQISFDKPLSHDGNDELYLHEIIQTGNIPSPDDNMMKESLVYNVNRALRKLSDSEASIISMSFGLSGTPKYTLQEIAMRYGISSERVRQIRSNGLFKLKNLLKENYTLLED